MAKTVDYYFYTWDENGYYDRKVSPRNIEIYFGKMLKKYEIVDTSSLDSKNKIYRLSYLAKKAQLAKQQVEQDEGFVYDYVVETRPDLYLGYMHPNRLKYSNLSSDEIVLDGALASSDFDTYQWTKWTASDGLGAFSMGHWYARMTSETYDRFSDRADFFSKHPPTNLNFHQIMGLYFVKNTQFKISHSIDPCICWPITPLMYLGNLPDYWDSVHPHTDAEQWLYKK